MKRISTKKQILSTAFILTFFAIAVPTLITSTLFINNLKKENTRHSIENFQQAETRINALLSNAHSIAYHALQKVVVQDYLFTEYTSSNEEIMGEFLFVQEVSQVIHSASNIATILFMEPGGKAAGYSATRRYLASADSTPILDKLDDLSYPGSTEWIGLVYSKDLVSDGDYQVSNEAEYKICGAIKTIFHFTKQPPTRKVYTLFEINPSSLWNLLSHLEYEGGSVFLLDQNGATLSGSYPAGSIPEFYNNIGDSDSGTFMFSANGNDSQHIIYYRMRSTGWILAKSIPKETYTKKMSSMWYTAILSGSIILCVLLSLYALWAKRFCLSITKLTDTIQELNDGNLDSRVTVNNKCSYEIALVCEKFNEMLDNINMLLLQKEQHERERADLEIKTLQSQISPHFIYNTLTSIRYMAFMLQAPKLEDALITFANIIRPIFSTWQADWSLKEELEFIKDYVSLIRLRYEQLIDIEIHTQDNANLCRIPRFTLQTLLENCCEHGFNGDRPLHICLTAEVRDGFLHIRVRDNGIGIPEEKLARIWERIRSTDNRTMIEGKHIGLANLDRRIKLFTGMDSGLDILSTPDEGTEITLRIRVTL